MLQSARISVLQLGQAPVTQGMSHYFLGTNIGAVSCLGVAQLVKISSPTLFCRSKETSL